MKQWVFAAFLISYLAVSAFGAAKGPEVVIVDNKVSITAEAIPLGRLLRLVDQATGMTSKVPAELANRNISVRFSGLPFEEGVRKMFQGQPFDYIFVQGQVIIVTAASQIVSPPDSAPAPVFNQPPGQVEQPNNDDNDGFVPQPIQPVPQPGIVPGGGPFGVVPGNPGNPQVQQQPAVIQTPFGPIANPRANQPVQPNGPNAQPFGGMAPFFQPPAPATNPNGQPNQNQNQNPLFGGSAPTFNSGQTNPQPLFGAQPGLNGQPPR